MNDTVVISDVTAAIRDLRFTNGELEMQVVTTFIETSGTEPHRYPMKRVSIEWKKVEKFETNP